MGNEAAVRSTHGYHVNCYSYYVPHIFTRAIVTAGACASVLAMSLAPGAWLANFAAELRRVDDLLDLDRSAANRATALYASASFALLLLPYLACVVWDVLSDNDFNAMTVAVIIVIIVAYEQFFILGLVIRYRLRMLTKAVELSFRSELETFSVLDRTKVSGRRHFSVSRPNSLKQTTSSPSCEHLLMIKIAHMKLRKLASSLNDKYAVPITAMTVQAFVMTVQVIFSILVILLDEDKDNDKEIFADVSYLVMNIISMYSLTCCCESIASQARRTVELTEHLILANETVGGSEAVTHELSRLSRQVRHSPISFSAWSLFSIHATLLTAFTSYVATYTIILLQFAVANTGCPTTSLVTSAINETTSPMPSNVLGRWACPAFSQSTQEPGGQKETTQWQCLGSGDVEEGVDGTLFPHPAQNDEGTQARSVREEGLAVSPTVTPLMAVP
ncbi:uncharacterized protein LOC126455425 [Schistocerca serialis cubense]|uniref:uncharacterized protein LOC126455425 n=1 Tax=Schistocerca serialis cubense TaxID=2023355 RepID=UPI00214EFEF1|nr:uncharacterized protein LOC126455425 [Schistocerca serialis cubense]